MNNLHILSCLFAAMRRGKTLKGHRHYCGFPTPPDDKNTAAICTTYSLTAPNWIGANRATVTTYIEASGCGSGSRAHVVGLMRPN